MSQVFKYNGKVYDVNKITKKILSDGDYKIFTISLNEFNSYFYDITANYWGKYKSIPINHYNLDILPDNIRDDHNTRVLNASLDYPIICAKEKKSGKIIVIDGIHRLIKSKLCGRRTINAHFVPDRLLSECVLLV